MSERDINMNFNAGNSSPEHNGELDAKLQGALGRALKAHYDDIISAPIPDRFLVLLAELEAKETRDDR